QLLLDGLALGAIYALVALGFVVIYRSSQVFNFAQGELLALGALSMVSLHELGVPWWLAVLGAMTISGLAGVLAERIFLRPLVGRPVFVTAIITIFVGLILRTLMVVSWGVEPLGMSPTPWAPSAEVVIFGAHVWLNSLAAIISTALALGAFFLLIKRTSLGVAMRATASDQEVAMALGIPVGRVFGSAWFIAGALAALAGILLGMAPRSVEVNLAFTALAAFPALIVGGLDSALGSVIAGLLLGVLQVLAEFYVNPYLGEFGKGFHLVFPYVVMILFMMVRPYGLMGSPEVERV
ncbi:MAG TPA: branched-chain amino acid ABC transporter permease, partial [Myxococcales bacterium]|nr:branched-chain amino acid ABC transporter permease [Myxococcales bacterium]